MIRRLVATVTIGPVEVSRLLLSPSCRTRCKGDGCLPTAATAATAVLTGRATLVVIDRMRYPGSPVSSADELGWHDTGTLLVTLDAELGGFAHQSA